MARGVARESDIVIPAILNLELMCQFLSYFFTMKDMKTTKKQLELTISSCSSCPSW